MIQNRIFKSRP